MALPDGRLLVSGVLAGRMWNLELLVATGSVFVQHVG